MPYIYSAVNTLGGKKKVGSTQCVALIQYFTEAPLTALWKPGAKVLGNRLLLPGTAIATFVNGRYLSKPHGNHAAFYLRQDTNAIWVMDQWADNVHKPVISARIISVDKQNSDGTWVRPSDNAAAFFVIERR